MLFVDYGNREIVDKDTVLSLPPEIASLPPVATKYTLRSLQPKCLDQNSEDFTKVTFIVLIYRLHLCSSCLLH